MLSRGEFETWIRPVGIQPVLTNDLYTVVRQLGAGPEFYRLVQ